MSLWTWWMLRRVDVHVHFKNPLVVVFAPPREVAHSVTVNVEGGPMYVGETGASVTATFYAGTTAEPPVAGTTVSFSSSDTAVLTIGTATATADGFTAPLTALAQGTADITTTVTVPTQPTFPQPGTVTVPVSAPPVPKPTHVVVTVQT